MSALVGGVVRKAVHLSITTLVDWKTGFDSPNTIAEVYCFVLVDVSFFRSEEKIEPSMKAPQNFLHRIDLCDLF